MKRILGVVGSPRKNGNTHILVATILEGARREGAAVDTLLLGDLTIRECDGCHACWKTGCCSKNDDMVAIYPRIIDADVIVFGTPVYWYGPTALMKAFLDRFVYFNSPDNRAKIKGHGAVLAVPYEEESPDTADLLISLFKKSLEYLEMPLLGQIIVPGVGEKGDVLKKPDCLAQCEELGRSLARGLPT